MGEQLRGLRQLRQPGAGPGQLARPGRRQQSRHGLERQALNAPEGLGLGQAPVVVGAMTLSAGASEAMAAQLSATQAARELALAACRRVIRDAGSAIRAVHRGDHDHAGLMRARSEGALRDGQAALVPHPGVCHAGFLQDAEKEYAEAVLTVALVEGAPLPTWVDLSIGLAPWLNGLCEAASELRRQVLDRLREGSPATAERLLRAMDSVYELLMTVDYPDAITGGLRRSTDALRAVLERTRSDLTTNALALRLQAALEEARGLPGRTT